MHAFLSRLITFVIGFFVLLTLVAVTFGVTGFSDKILTSVINEELRAERQALAQSIRDPDELQAVLEIRHQELNELHGIGKPWQQRMPKMMWRIITLDLGCAKTLRSFSGDCAISTIVLERMSNTLIMMMPTFVLVSTLGIWLGQWSATHAGTRLDRALSILAVGTRAWPAWWIGINLILIFSNQLGWLPQSGMYSTPPPEGTFAKLWDLARHATLPVLSLTLSTFGAFFYPIRSMMVRTAQEPFVQFARIRGLPEGRVKRRYILRPASPAIVTSLTLAFVASFSGAILTETVFNWPGMGQLYVQAILGTPDEGLIVALTAIYGAMFMAARFVLEFVYVALDPRIRS